MSERPQPRTDLRLAQSLAADLDAADLRSEPLRRLWGEEADDALARGMSEPILRALADRDDPLPTLGRLFVLGMPQPLAAVERALSNVGVDGIHTLGLAHVEGATVVPDAIIRPQSFVDGEGVGEWWIASDLDEVALGTTLPADHVLGVGGASRTLAELVIPASVDRALDLGTGCGIQALLVSRHAGVVVATDISARALAFAELNAQLNGVSNVEFRRGSMFEPVAGETFDLIVSNPPFVITPRVQGVPEYEYRDGGLVGDALVELFLRGVGAHLAAGGVAQLLGNWETRAGTAGLDRVDQWIDAGLDAWVVEREELTPLTYAELWIRDGGTLPRDAGFTPLLGAWLDDFATREVSAIGFGYILVRRPVVPTARHLRRFERVTHPVSGLGRAYASGLAAHDLLHAGIPHTLTVAADVTEARHHLPGSEHPSVIELRQGGGFARTVNADSALAALVGASDGDLTVLQIVEALAELFEVSLSELWADLEPRVRELVRDGILVPAATE